MTYVARHVLRISVTIIAHFYLSSEEKRRPLHLHINT